VRFLITAISKKTEIENCYFNEHIKFDNCVFNENLVLQSEYENVAFQEVSFLKQVIFTGRINHSAAFSDCSFEGKITFKGRRTRRGVHFSDVNFEQPLLKRSGLYAETFLLDTPQLG